MTGSNGARAARDRVLDELREADKFVLTTHENPDGDALGSLAAMQRVLTALGKDALAFMAADEFPLPYEYRFIELEGLITEPP
jgi:bifunctional oligoribonuclease and PAP phosphatase NrnA